MTVEEAFGKSLREFRRGRELTQEGLAFESELARNYISLLEQGKKSPSLRAIFRLCDAMKVSPEELIGDVVRRLRESTAG